MKSGVSIITLMKLQKMKIPKGKLNELNEMHGKCCEILRSFNVTLHPFIPIFIVNMKQDRKHV